MGVVSIPKPGKLIAGLLLYQPGETKGPLLRRLVETFGPIDRTTPEDLFNKSDYYEKEMGAPLYRVFISFERLVPPDALPEIKLAANAIEADFPNLHGGRKVNIDPGILTLQNLVLATTKNYTHRIYLGKGIYGDLTLIFQKGGYQSLPWTYPDYREEAPRAFFMEVRTLYKEQLKELAP